MVRQWQHGEQDVDRGSPQVGRIYIHLEFGQLPVESRKSSITATFSKPLKINLTKEIIMVWECYPQSIQEANYTGSNPKPVWPVWYNSLQRSYEVWHHHIDALQVSAKERGRVENDRSQNWPTDEIRDLETLNQDHVEPAERGKRNSFKWSRS